MTPPRSFLIIQTAFIGDVILATALVEKLHSHFPGVPIDFLLRKGNEGLLTGHPFIRNVLVWDKKQGKLKNLFSMISRVRASRYDWIINVHRFASSGMITAFSGANVTSGFDKNPLSRFFDHRLVHVIKAGVHEVQRNQGLIASITDSVAMRPRLYPGTQEEDAVLKYKNENGKPVPYVCIAPTSVWFTKQYPAGKWIELIDRLKTQVVYLLGASSDQAACDFIKAGSTHGRVVNLAGALNFLESAALMQNAVMNYVNDSAPMHLASAVNAPVTAVYCSTVPEFGFGPLSDVRFVVQTPEKLDCRPCGLHGFRACPKGHFRCAGTIALSDFQATI